MGRNSLVDERQEEIKLAFYDVAKEVGLENASIAKVADKMNISKGLVMHYYATKESLIMALNDHILKSYLEFVVSEKYLTISTKNDLEHYINSLFSREWCFYIDDGVFYSYYALIYQNNRIRKNYKTFIEALRNGISQILVNCVNKGIIANNNIPETSNLLYALIDGAYFQLGAYLDNEEIYTKKAKIYAKHGLSLLHFI